MTQEEQLEQALRILEDYVHALAEEAGESKTYAADLWERIKGSSGVLQELSYYHDYGDFLGKYCVSGYTLPDILVWQVDHFKAYMDRHEEMNRWRPQRLFLRSLDTMLQMERDPDGYVEKMRGETGTDFEGKF